MKKYALCCLITSFYATTQAQQKFSQSIGGAGNDEALYCKPTNDGGYINVGWTTSFGAGNWDLYLVKTDSLGQILWTKTYGGTGDEADCSVEQTSDKGYIIASRTNSFGVGNSDIYIVKTDSMGNLMWSKTYGGSVWEEGHSIVIANDGYVHVGFTDSYGAGNDDIYMMKIDFAGNMLWASTFGGIGNDHGHKVKIDSSGSFLIAGTTNSFNNLSYDFYLIKVSNQGDILWSKTYGASQDDIGWDVQAFSDSYYMTGYTNSAGQGLNDFLLLKTDLNGNILWSKTYGGAGDELAYAIEKTKDNHLLLTGETSSFGNGDEDIFIIKTDLEGNVTWSKTYGGMLEDGSQYAQNASDSGYIISGYTQSFGGGQWDFCMIKTDAQGNASSCNENNISITAVSQTISDNSPLTIATPASFLTGSNPNTIVSIGGQNYPCSPLSVEQIDQLSYEVFPNPCQDKLSIVYKKISNGFNQEIKYYLRNIQGQTVYFGSFDASNDGTLNIQMATLNRGLYFLEIANSSYIIQNQKVIKN